MPTYEYECERCGHLFELFQSMTDPPRKRCPACRGKVKRLFGTGAGIIFKGSGFYQTDYRSSDYKQAAEKDKSASTSTSGASKTDGKTSSDTKPKKKAAAKA